MRFWFYILSAATVLAGTGMLVSASNAQGAKAEAPAPNVASAHEFSMVRIDGKPLPLDQYRGKVMLVVNTASFCGFTPQYEGLQKLHARYGPKGFTVLGVPSGDFGGQEHGKNEEIAEFCESKFGITFPMTEKANVKGPNAAPFYRWAKASLPDNNVPQWNFHKFLVGKDGKLIAGFGSRVNPDSPELQRAIEKALAA